ncbi:MAG: 1-deoxy-D-xylulose-5-phosphate synthase [Treponema sp.]|nr:1-deoxy-D-xylulose-5-phosphate synthase [Treponema sp.]
MLETITSPSDIKKLSQKELKVLASQIREKIIQTVAKNGGHLASNLGVVELTIALHRVFNSPDDAIIWDVSHQCYAHKLLTGRYKSFDTLRTKNGISGFTNTKESPHDFFINGHSSTSISSALGLLTAWNLNNNNHKVIAVIGDGALTGGMAFEGLSHAGQLCKNLIVVLNDNQMSIDHNTGSISRYLSRLSMSPRYQSFRYKVDKIIDKIPYLGPRLEKFIFRFKRSLKGLLLTNNLFTDLGFEYVGPLDGHNELSMEKIFKKVQKLHRPVVVHVVTKKGKGYSPAENNPEIFHGIGPFQTSDGKVDNFEPLSFTEAFSNIIVNEAEQNDKIVGITAAMSKGTGLAYFSKKFPDRFFDVGIAEEHAVTFAGGLAAGGLIPVVCIYSTFIQRAVDQIIHDVVLQKAHVIFMLDRAGAVPNDGVTHQGIFDISLFLPVPELEILSPSTSKDLYLCFKYALKSDSAVIIRYPKLSCPRELSEQQLKFDRGRGILIPSEKKSNAKKILIVCTGGMYTEVLEAVNKSNSVCDIYILRFIKPFDEKYFLKLASDYKGIVFVEDGVKIGGISEYLSLLLNKNKFFNVKILAFDNRFYEHGNRNQILEEAGLSIKSILSAIKETSK